MRVLRRSDRLGPRDGPPVSRTEDIYCRGAAGPSSGRGAGCNSNALDRIPGASGANQRVTAVEAGMASAVERAPRAAVVGQDQ